MKTSQADFRFPVLGLTTDLDVWGLPDLDALTTCGSRTLKDGLQLGMELIDADGRRWLVHSVKRIGRAGSLFRRLLYSPAQLRIEHELEALQPVSLAETQDRVCAAMKAHPDFWCQEDELDTVLRAQLAEVTAATTISGIHDVLGLDTFEPY